MKWLILLLLPVFAQGQIITVYAGNDTAGNNGDGGLATHAELYDPAGVSVDLTGNLYITDGDFNIVRKVDTVGIITTIAGTGSMGYSGDGGPATAAAFFDPIGIAVDGIGDLFIVDNGDDVIRKIDTAGVITTVAGNNTLGYGYSGDGGPATNAQLNDPYAVTVDNTGNLYIADAGNDVVRKVNASGIITTFAGNCASGLGYSGDGGAATDAQLYYPNSLAIDHTGDVYIADQDNNVIRKVNTSGIISTFAGSNTGTVGYSGDGGPATAAKLNTPWALSIDDSDNLYIADLENNVIRRVTFPDGIITTVAGNGINGYTGNGGPATASELTHPTGVTVGTHGDFYIGDIYDYVVRKVTVPKAESGISIVGVKNDIAIYPNPAITDVTITSAENITSIMITDILGQTIYNYKCNSLKVQVNVEQLPSGVYFIKVNNNEARKFVKE